MELFQRRVQVGDMSMFTQLCEQLVNEESAKITFENFVIHHLSSVIDSLKQYFPDIDNRQSNSWILRPFSTNDEIFEDEDVSAKVEHLGLRENSTFKVDFQNYDLGTFWRKVGAEYPIIADRALRILIPFATTYRCGSENTNVFVTSYWCRN